jgi:hypothetical protein
MERFWHPRFNWYGPAGIGTARGVRGFRAWHQIPFLRGMPDRGQMPMGCPPLLRRRRLCRRHRLARTCASRSRGRTGWACPPPARRSSSAASTSGGWRGPHPRELGARRPPRRDGAGGCRSARPDARVQQGAPGLRPRHRESPMILPQSPSFRLDGRRALVTGASSGIGLAAATALARAGAQVALVARREGPLARAHVAALAAEGHRGHRPCPRHHRPRRHRRLRGGHGPFDVLVNAAGLARHSARRRHHARRLRRRLRRSTSAPPTSSRARSRRA